MITNLGTLNQLVGIFNDAFDLNDELVLTLIGVMLPGPFGEMIIRTLSPLARGLNGRHRVAKSVTSSFRQSVGHRGFDKINHQVRTLLANIDSCARITRSTTTPFAILATTEHHITDGMLCADQALLSKAS